jgi:hypothetical protein
LRAKETEIEEEEKKEMSEEGGINDPHLYEYTRNLKLLIEQERLKLLS